MQKEISSFESQIQEFTLVNGKSLSKEVLQRIKQYAKECQNIGSGNRELVEFLASKPLSTIDSCFNSELSFGTAGFRAEMSPGTNRMNPVSVIKVCLGIAEYLEKDLLLQPKITTKNLIIIIGHDHRHFSHDFALKAANVFSSKGFQVLAFSSPIPTPLVPFCVGKYAASFGIMITASHNSKEYNGIKVYSSQGTQINKPVDELIMSRIKQINLDFPLIESPSLSCSKEDILQSAKRDYSNYLNRFVIPFSFPLKITFTAFHGVGFSWAQECCFTLFPNLKVHSLKEQQEPNADFPTLPKPNPEINDSLKMGIQNAIENDCHLLVAVDPDADRFRAIEFISSGNDSPNLPIMFNGNQLAIIMMAFNYSLFEGQGKLALVTTKVSSKVPLIFGESKGIKVVITDTGFKNIGKEVQRLQKEGFKIILAFEEAIGFIPGTLTSTVDGDDGYLIPDKDGLAAMTAFLSAAGQIYSEFSSLQEYLNRFCHENRIWFSSCNRSFPMNKSNQGQLNLSSLCKQLNDDESKTCIFTFFQIKRAHLESPSFLTIEFTSKEHEICWIALRASGTEPIMKLYSEIISRKDPKATEILPSLIDEFCAKYSPHWN